MTHRAAGSGRPALMAVVEPEAPELPRQLLKAAPKRQRASSRRLAPAEDVPGGRRIVCASCGFRITTTGCRIVVGGQHEHTQVNPAGLLFRIGCFSRAPGCRQIGDRSGYWTWFSGYTWQVCLCRGCGDHLGWRFDSGEHWFFGLVLEKVVEVKE